MTINLYELPLNPIDVTRDNDCYILNRNVGCTDKIAIQTAFFSFVIAHPDDDSGHILVHQDVVFGMLGYSLPQDESPFLYLEMKNVTNAQTERLVLSKYASTYKGKLGERFYYSPTAVGEIIIEFAKMMKSIKRK